MKVGFGPFKDKLLDKPDCSLMPFCAVCGSPAHDKHHVIQKGMGGVTKEAERRIPKIRLCGFGNNDGCHGLLHHRRLHIYWEDGIEDEEPGWVFYISPEPMDDQECWEMNRAAYLPLPGWEEQRGVEEHVIGSGKPMG